MNEFGMLVVMTAPITIGALAAFANRWPRQAAYVCCFLVILIGLILCTS